MEVNYMIPKFRAWDEDSKVMRSWKDLILEKDGGDDFWLIGYKENACITSFDHDQILMQSTGLIDKNGTEIYEGDIVHVLDSEQINQRDENGAFIDAFFEEIDEIDSVVFADGSFKLKRTGFDVCICRSVDVFKIIGNIYENPELLEAIE